MNTTTQVPDSTGTGRRRRWFVAVDPIFEAGREGPLARAWDVEDELVAVALLGDVTIDLTHTRSTPREVAIDAYAIAIGRDVDILVDAGDHIEITDVVVNTTEARIDTLSARTIRIHGYGVLGHVTIRATDG